MTKEGEGVGSQRVGSQRVGSQRVGSQRATYGSSNFKGWLGCRVGSVTGIGYGKWGGN